MGLKTHTGQANPNPNIKAQANTLSAKPLSPFKPKGTVKQTQTEPEPKSQTVGLSKAKQSQTKEPQPLSPSQEPTLSPSRRQFIEQYGAYALVTPVALYAMMSPNRAMAQAASVGVVADDAVAAARPTVLNDQDRIENFDINTKTDGYVDSNGELGLEPGSQYIAPDGVVYTCTNEDYGCIITPTEGGGAKANHDSTFDITYPVADDTADAVDDTTDDPVDAVDPVDDTADAVDDVAAADVVVVSIGAGDTIPDFDINKHTDGQIYYGELILKRNQKYIGVDGKHYTCAVDECYVSEDDGSVHDF